jgi:hypothetical protein
MTNRVVQTPTQVSKRDDVMRIILAGYTTIQALALILFFGVAPFMRNPAIKPEESTGIVELLLPLFTGYIGTIVGFYFGLKGETK